MTQPYVWARDKRNLAEHYIRQAIDDYAAKKHRTANSPGAAESEKKEAKKVARKLDDRSLLSRIIDELKTRPKLVQAMEDFDTDEWILNTPAGVVDLRTGEISPPDPSLLCSRATEVPPGELPEDSLWLSFLRDTTGGDEDLQAYLQRLVGYSLTGSTQEQTLAFVHGPTESGKSTFLDALRNVLGSYCVTSSTDTFAKTTNRGVPADLAMMAGARLVTASETEEGRPWDTQRVKAITGGDEVTARFLYQNPFSYKPQYQVIVVGNHEPEVEGVDEAIMRRLHIVPFDHRVAEEDRDRQLGDKLKDEYPGILTWAIEGCLAWLEQGLNPPEAVLKRTEHYRREEDPLGMFIEERCEIGDPGYEVSRRALFDSWETWCWNEGITADIGSRKTFKRRFRPKEIALGLEDTRVDDDGKMRRGYSGIRLKEGIDHEHRDSNLTAASGGFTV